MTSTLGSRALALSLFLVPLACACGGEDDEAADEAEAAPLLGLFNLPISLHNQGTAPTDALRIEISPDEFRADGHTLLTLQRGRADASETPENVITVLRDHIRENSARRTAAISIHTNAPYIILVQTLNTLKAEGLSEVHFAVRSTSDAEGWLPIRSFQVAPAEGEITWQTEALAWSAFTEHWDAVYQACQAGQNIDCDAPYTNTAEGGTLAMELWTRAQGMKVTFSQIAPTAEELAVAGEAPPQPTEMIEGVRAPPAPVEDELAAPAATSGSFNFRQQETAHEGSALSEAVRPVCANQACRTEVVADATGASMRVISMIGAVFPNGFTDPEIVFRLPE